MASPVNQPADGPILLRNTMRIAKGHLEQYKSAVRAAVEFVEQRGPQLMVEVFIDEPSMRAYSFQLYADSAAILEHWRLTDPHIQQVMEHCDVEALDVYGQPDQEVVRNLPQPGGNVPVTVVPHFTGFVRPPQLGA